MLKQSIFCWAVLCLLIQSTKGAAKPSKFTRFRPITQSEYDAILSLTDGKPVVSEGRLITSGLAALAGLTTGWMTSLRLSDILASVGLVQKSPDDSYPLCVIKNGGIENEGNHHHDQSNGHLEHHNRQSYQHTGDSYDSAEHDNYHTYHEHYLEGDSHEHHSSSEHEYEHEYGSVAATDQKNKLAPVVNCIVVLKKDEHTDGHGHGHYHAPSKPTKQTRRRQKPHSQLPLSTSYIYPTSIVQRPPPPPPGSYNSNPWYWQTPYYNPYYSNQRVYTNLHPLAYSNIYATTNPGAYPFNYPGILPNHFTTPTASNNLNANNDPLTNAVRHYATSGISPIDINDSQSSGHTSNYPDIENAVVGVNNRPDADETLSQVNYPSYNDEDYRPNHISPAYSQSSPSSLNIPMKLLKNKVKQTTKSHPQKQVNSASSSTLTKYRHASKRTKAKRDESGIQSNSYAKIATYSQSGYQTASYPQNSYTSNYPKLSFTHALPYSAPVYVRNSIEQPKRALKIKWHHGSDADSEEKEDEGDFIQVRNY